MKDKNIKLHLVGQANGEYHLRALDNKKIWKALKMKPSSISKDIFVKYKNRLVALETIDKFNFEFLLIINEADSNGVAYILRKSLTGGSKNKNSQRMIITNAKSGYPMFLPQKMMII